MGHVARGRSRGPAATFAGVTGLRAFTAARIALLTGLGTLTALPLPAARAEVAVRTGAFSQRFVDVLEAGGLRYPIARTYQSQSTHAGLFGPKWQSELETSLTVQKDGMVVVNEAGFEPRTEFAAARPGETEMHAARSPGQKLVKSATGFVRTRDDGVTDYFSPGGKLIRVLDGANYIDFRYAAATQRLESLTDNLGQKFNFQRDLRGRITRIYAPDAAVPDGTTLASYEYNEAGELVRSRGQPIPGASASAATKGPAAAPETVFTYKYSADARHLLTEIDYADRTTLQITYYDASHQDRVRTYKDRQGQQVAYTYASDSANPDHTQASAKISGPYGQRLAELGFEYFVKHRSGGEPWLYRLISTRDGQSTTTLFDETTGKPIEARDEATPTPEEEAALRAMLPAVMRVETIGRGCLAGGTAFFVTPDGLAVTNRHVLAPALKNANCRIRLTIPGPLPLRQSWAGLSKAQLRHVLDADARVSEQLRIVGCGKTAGRDLCVFKANFEPERNFRVEAGFPKEGSPVFTIGNPLNEGLLIDHGTFVGRENRNGVSQVSISILTRPGNSGGPIFTPSGQLVGLHSAQYTYQGAYAGKGIANSRTEQAGISAFELQGILDEYARTHKSYTLDEYRAQVVPGIAW